LRSVGVEERLVVVVIDGSDCTVDVGCNVFIGGVYTGAEADKPASVVLMSNSGKGSAETAH